MSQIVAFYLVIHYLASFVVVVLLVLCRLKVRT